MTMQTQAAGSGPLRTILMSTGALLLVVAVVLSPKQAFDASIQGLDIWWKLIFPSMLPFLMLSQMLHAFGFTAALGVLFEPLMKTCFRLPGQAGLVFAFGMIGGFPAGADMTARLVEEGKLSDRQAAALASFAHFANPMVIVLVIGAVFLQQPAAGYFLLLIHWFSAWTTAILLSRLTPMATGQEASSPQTTPPRQSHKGPIGSKNRTASQTAPSSLHPPRNLLRRMLNAAREAHLLDGRSFGKLLGDTVSQAVQTLMMTGGYIIVFAVLIRLLGLFLTPGSPVAMWPAFLEMHLGVYHLSKSHLDQVVLIALTAAVLGWGGLCSHLQVFAALKSIPMTKGHLFRFAAARVLHGLIAFGAAVLLWTPFARYLPGAQATFHPYANADGVDWSQGYSLFRHYADGPYTLWHAVPAALVIWSALLLAMAVLSGLLLWINRRVSP